MALAQLPVYVAWAPPVAPPVRLTGVALVSFRPVGPASEAGAIAAVCLTSVAELGVDVAGPSRPVCPGVATILVLS